MDMEKVIGLIFALILIGCQDCKTMHSKKNKSCMIKSQGSLEVLPDKASFSINLSCLKMTTKLSKNCLVEKSNELKTKLLSFGIKEEDILTTSVDLRKSYTWKRNSNVFEGYMSSTVMYVTLKDITTLDAIYTELLENRNLELGGLNYSHSKLDSLKNEAYSKALKKSGVLVDKLLLDLPESNKEVLKIGNVQITSSLPSAHESDYEKKVFKEVSSLSKNKSVAINKGTVVVNATLYVEYGVN